MLVLIFDFLIKMYKWGGSPPQEPPRRQNLYKSVFHLCFSSLGCCCYFLFDLSNLFTLLFSGSFRFLERYPWNWSCFQVFLDDNLLYFSQPSLFLSFFHLFLRRLNQKKSCLLFIDSVLSFLHPPVRASL